MSSGSLQQPLLAPGSDAADSADTSSSLPPQRNSVDRSDSALDLTTTGKGQDEHPELVNCSESEYTTRGELKIMWSLGWPAAVSFACRMAMASTDAAFVGHIRDGPHSPSDYLSAATLSDMITSILMVPPLAFNQVLNAMVGQAMGSDNPKMAGFWLQQSLLWLTAGMLPCMVGYFYVDRLLLVLGFNADIAALAGRYARVNVFWAIPNGWYQCMRFYFQAQGKPRPAMYNNIAFVALNALLNWVFVFGGPFRYLARPWRGMGFIGAAVSLSCSRTLQPLAYWLYMFVWRRAHVDTWPGWRWELYQRKRIVDFLKQSLPLVGTLLFQQVVGQSTTLLISQIGTDNLAVAYSSALNTVTMVWSGAMNATFGMIIAIRVGYHLGKGDTEAAKAVAWLMMKITTICMLIVVALYLPLGKPILSVATSQRSVQIHAAVLIPAMLVSTYLQTVVNNCTSGVFSGQGRTFLTTILAFGLEIPFSIGSVALLVLYFKGTLLQVYWLQAATAALEAAIVIALLWRSNWRQYAIEARQRQEAGKEDRLEDPAERDEETPREEAARLPSDRRDGSAVRPIGDAFSIPTSSPADITAASPQGGSDYSSLVRTEPRPVGDGAAAGGHSGSFKASSHLLGVSPSVGSM